MDYEKKYKCTLETIFHELGESEDERIKEEIKVILANTDLSQFALDYTFADMINWLDKKGKTSDTLIWGCVDLGLPSGTLWATMNVGATSETDSGLYFAWGDTQGYTASQVGNGKWQKVFDWDDYKFGFARPYSKYDTDGLTTLELTDDAAYNLSNGQYVMPTRKQFKELIENTNSKWDDERKGCVFVSKINGKELFFPAVGGCSDGSVNDAGLFGYYWSSSLKSSKTDFAWYLVLISGEEMEMSIDNRCFGNSVRGVLLQK